MSSSQLFVHHPTSQSQAIRALTYGMEAAKRHATWDNILQTAYLTIASVVVYGVWLALYRVFFHPLASIPGPKLAAITTWYEKYYDVFLGAQYFRRIEEMHRQYGPVVRIRPDEVSFNDPDFIDTLSPVGGRRTTKPALVGLRTGIPDSITGTIDHDVHRRRRNAISGFFSVASIRRLEPIITAHMEKMFGRVDASIAASGAKSVVLSMHQVFRACTSDIITTYAFGENQDILGEDDWGESVTAGSNTWHNLTHVFAAFPVVLLVMRNLPQWAFRFFIPSRELDDLMERKEWWVNKVRTIRESPDPAHLKSTIFEGVLSSNLPAEEKTDARLAQEAQLIVFAGEGTVAYTLNAALYELLAHPAEYRRAREELRASLPAGEVAPSFAQVETLPFLSAVIHETMRLHPGVVSRQVRISPDQPIVYQAPAAGLSKTYVVPPGMCHSMSTRAMHLNGDVFDDPLAFRPQRWLDDPTLGRAFIAFARGTRNCIGKDMAKKLMGKVLATLLLRYDIYEGQRGPTLELYDTTRERDIDANYDMIIPMPAKGSPGLRVGEHVFDPSMRSSLGSITWNTPESAENAENAETRENCIKITLLPAKLPSSFWVRVKVSDCVLAEKGPKALTT
ncbi:cytochrome P450 CYP682H1 [Chaetomium fimeti]|uniref:Cytochrome P450 CYP682H1 n=1 Tax=Chaetomium fimeti TaxID=1854472 RepID=A0AAE0LP20_9PEZI|nr:cytochrome P450 CYP682H1 [Chaetomium fimeti]